MRLNLGLALVLSGMIGVAQGAPGDITLVSVRAPGQVTSMYDSSGAHLSADGRFLAFYSNSPDLVPNTTDVLTHVYVRNLQSGVIERVSVDSRENAAIADSDGLAISADGRYVAFATTASNLVARDANAVGDIFVRDRQSGLTEIVSVNSTGGKGSRASYAPSISADGRYVAFGSRAANLSPGDSNQSDDIFVRDRQTGRTERVSVTSAGVQGNYSSFAASISADGRYVAFVSHATKLVAGDSNNVDDVFMHDRVTGKTERVSVASGGAQVDGASSLPATSADGRYVAFLSDATNLVPGDTNGVTDVFVRDRQTGRTERVNVNSSGMQTVGYVYSQPSISADGRYVSFASSAANFVTNDSNDTDDVFVHDRLTGQTLLASMSSSGVRTNSWSFGGSLSADGRHLGFDSYASNLVTGDRNGTSDVFVRDRQASTVTVASTNKVVTKAAGSYDFIDCVYERVGGPSISADGRYVAFLSSAPNLVPGQPLYLIQNPRDALAYAFVRDLQTGKTQQISSQVDAVHVAMSADGSTVAVWDSCIGHPYAFIWDRLTGQSEPLPGDTYFVDGLSADGRYVAFPSTDATLVPGDSNAESDIFVKDRHTGQIERVSVKSTGLQADGYSQGSSISANGRYVAFTSHAVNLVSGDTNGFDDVFVRDRSTGKTGRVSVNSAGGQMAGGTYLEPRTAISADGRYVTFATDATNLVAGDLNATADVFVRDRQTGLTERVSVDSNGVEGNGSSYTPAISPDGRYVQFSSSASNLVPGGNSGALYIHDRQTGLTEELLIDPKTNIAISGSSPSMSADQRFAAFITRNSLVKTDLNETRGYAGAQDVYLLERAVSTTALTLSPRSLALGNQRVSSASPAQSVTVTNSTVVAVAITGFTLAGANAGQFGVTHNCGNTLPANASCTINVVFKPATKGAKSATLNVNGGGGGLRVVTLTGTGT